MNRCDIRKALALYAVTDRMWLSRPFPAEDSLGIRALCMDVESCIQGGVTMVQLREKEVTHEQYVQIGKAVQNVCRRYRIPFIIDDDVSVASELHADGVHTGQSDMDAASVRKIIGPDMILGISAQTVEQALTAQAAGADYIGTGAVFSTTTKADAETVSLQTLAQICRAVSIPVVAIGGISSTNIAQLVSSGVAGAAVVSALFAAPDRKAAAEQLLPFCIKMQQRCTAGARYEKEKQNRGQVLGTMKAAVFDMDGTLLDSMPMWEHAGDMYLRSKGIEPACDMWKDTKSLSMEETARYFISRYRVDGTPESVMQEINAMIQHAYVHDLLLKPGAAEFLAFLAHKNIPLILATATDRECIEPCFRRLGILDSFSTVLTCTELGAGKDTPDIYFEAARCAGTDIQHTVVFEDASYAGRTAQRADFPVCAVYDRSAALDGTWNEFCRTADCMCMSFTELREAVRDA